MSEDLISVREEARTEYFRLEVETSSRAELIELQAANEKSSTAA